MSLNQDYIYQIIQSVPRGKVAYYGQISEILEACYQVYMRGQIVGWTMSSMRRTGKYQDVNWQRIVAKTGQIVTYKVGFGMIQAELLAGEGVIIKDGLIDMTKDCIKTLQLLEIYTSRPIAKLA